MPEGSAQEYVIHNLVLTLEEQILHLQLPVGMEPVQTHDDRDNHLLFSFLFHPPAPVFCKVDFHSKEISYCVV